MVQIVKTYPGDYLCTLSRQEINMMHENPILGGYFSYCIEKLGLALCELERLSDEDCIREMSKGMRKKKPTKKKARK